MYTSFGELGAATAYQEELRAATEATGIAPGPYGALSLAALRGREAEFTELIRTTVKEAEARGEGLALTVTERLSGALYNGLGRYHAALTAVGQVERYHEEGPALWALGELIEAAVRTGQPQLARGSLAWMAETTRSSGTDWGLGIEARCRALLTEGDDADGLYREAIERFGRTHIRVQLARSHLLYGEWLRRERRRLDAREQLRTAFEMFDAMGIEAFAARAERELLPTGERARKRTVETRDDLTAQEARIARLAAEGLSNAEIGSRLFISQHTVAYHLRKVFANSTSAHATSSHQPCRRARERACVGATARVRFRHPLGRISAREGPPCAGGPMATPRLLDRGGSMGRRHLEAAHRARAGASPSHGSAHRHGPRPGRCQLRACRLGRSGRGGVVAGRGAHGH